VVLLPRTDLPGAQRVAEMMRAAVAALGIAHGAVPAKRLSLSIGVASLVPDAESPPDDLLRRAATALYIAKTMGRNRIVADEPITVPLTPR
jgi:diguanylate cyclase (GGDEF)-like protein